MGYVPAQGANLPNLGNKSPAGSRDVFGHRDSGAQTACPGNHAYDNLGLVQLVSTSVEPPKEWDEMASKAEIAKIVHDEVGNLLGIRNHDGTMRPRGEDAKGNDKMHNDLIGWWDFQQEIWQPVITLIKEPDSHTTYVFNGASKEYLTPAAWDALNNNLVDAGSGHKMQLHRIEVSKAILDAIPDTDHS
jgi:hypothetical protein